MVTGETGAEEVPAIVAGMIIAFVLVAAVAMSVRWCIRATTGGHLSR